MNIFKIAHTKRHKIKQACSNDQILLLESRLRECLIDASDLVLNLQDHCEAILTINRASKVLAALSATICELNKIKQMLKRG